ncbi:S8 family serine peptidase [Blastomonas sp.]|uniref:S8 family serine peptidase n=1 Tax=Blastomonas sp. TaxID=1909299 RepID=UPI0035930E85
MMAGICKVLLGTAIATMPVAASPQIGIPALPNTRIGVESISGPLLRDIDLDRLTSAQIAEQLQIARIERLTSIVRQNRDRVEFDAQKAPALRGVLLATGVTPAHRAKAEAAGYRVLDEEVIEGLDLSFTRFALPQGESLRAAQKKLANLLPDADISADNLYFASGLAPPLATSTPSIVSAQSAASANARLGLIDSGVGKLTGHNARVVQKGFARGAPRAGGHGTAVASLALSVSGPGSSLYAADVYGDDPAGGTASSIARALGWLISQQTSVINISLVGPNNALVRAAIARAQAKGALIVAAVGNDGPAAAPAYPAAQSGVLAVTGVDQAGRVLPEAGRGKHVAFAAPGRNLALSVKSGKKVNVRGTSFAAPLVAGRLAQLYPVAAPSRSASAVHSLIAEARDLGKKGRDPVFGHGLVCADCGR